MKTRSNRLNGGYIGTKNFIQISGVESLNKNYLNNQFDTRGFTSWSIPSNWLSMPAMTEGDQKISSLYAIYPGGSGAIGSTASGNFFAFILSGCTYIVDWGNGTTQSYSSGTRAQYNYDFAGISSSTFLPDLGCRQVIMQAYPETVGTTFSQANYNTSYTVSGVTISSNYTQSILGHKICSNSLTTLALGRKTFLKFFEYVGESNLTTGNSLFDGARSLELLSGTSWTSKMTNFGSMFSACTALQTIPLLNTSKGIAFNSMFVNCHSLKIIPELDTSSGTNFSSMFQSCFLMQTIPLLNTSKGTGVSSMFQDCSSLKTIPSLNTSSSTTFNSMFRLCYSLQAIPFLNTSSGTNFASMFQDCGSLQTIPDLNTSSSTTVSAMFGGCRSLESIPLLNTSSVTNFSNMFQDCSSLQEIPLLNTSKGTDFSFMFQRCSSLVTIPLLNTSSGTNFQSTFSNCTSLQSIPLLNGASGTNFQSTFTSCSSLRTIPPLNVSSGTNFSNMFSSCVSLQTVSALNTSKGTNFNGMFNTCSSLTFISGLTFTGATGSSPLSTIFANCSALQFLPPINISSSSSASSVPFSNCFSLKAAVLNGMNASIDYSNCNLSPAALNDIFTGLSATGTGKTITITNNWGASGCNSSIATAKGWAVAG
jgi:surface protein